MSSLTLLLILLATTLLILSTATGQIVDNTGNLVRNNGAVRIYADGGYIGTKSESPTRCSRSFVALRFDRALPPRVRIFQMTKQGFLNQNQDLAIDFGGVDPICRQSGVWQLTIDGLTRRLVVTTGGTSFENNSRFQIQGPVDDTVDPSSFEYKILFCPEQGSGCTELKVLKDDYLGVGNGGPLLVRFSPASHAKEIDFLSII